MADIRNEKKAVELDLSGVVLEECVPQEEARSTENATRDGS